MSVVIDPFLPGVTWFTALALVMPVFVRLPWPASPSLRPLLGALVVYAIGLMAASAFWTDGYFWPSSAIYGFLFMGLWFAHGAASKSVSLFVAQCLLDRPSGVGIDLIRSLIVETEFDSRADLLAASGQTVVGPDGCVTLTDEGRRSVHLLNGLRKLMAIEGSGHYRFEK
jgi:hypothetical protein